MKSSILNAHYLIILAFFLNACSDSQLATESEMVSNVTIESTPTNQYDHSKITDIIIYDSNNDITGLDLVPIKLQKTTGDTKKDVITAFLNHNHFLENNDQMSLSRIEEIGKSTTFYLTYLNDLENGKDLYLFKKALELTLLRHLKNNDFNIIYGQTAHL